MSEGRVLVGDDDERVRQAVGLVLTKAGYEVIEAEGGAPDGVLTEVLLKQGTIGPRGESEGAELPKSRCCGTSSVRWMIVGQ